MSSRTEPSAPGRPEPREVVLAIAGRRLGGTLAVPEGARGLVLFAHGSGSSRHSPRNREVAAALQARGMATLLMDLLEEAEALDRRNVFDIDLMARRLDAATDWVKAQPATAALPVAFFGASTGAAVALKVAAERPEVAAVVSRGGRPDLAAGALERVRAPTLLIVGGLDTAVLALNERAAARLAAERRLEVVPGAGHLFEEPGKLAEVAHLAGDWFATHWPGAP